MKPKKDINDLATLGGEPCFSVIKHVGAPNIGDRARFIARTEAAFDRRWFSNDGPLMREFETALCMLTGARHCVAMCNATVALEIATRAMGLSGEVIVPSMTFIATPHALSWQGITPVFCDIDPVTLCLDPVGVEKLITPRTRGIIGVHIWGNTCDVQALRALATHHHLPLLFDAAHALGCTRSGIPVGGLGEVEVFSFHATKFVNAFEGGAVVTDDAALADKMRLMRNFGFSGYDNVVYEGTNGKMNEISAAMGLTSLESMDEFIVVNRRNYEAYRMALRGVPGLSFLHLSPDESTNYQYVVIFVDKSAAGIGRDQLMDLLWAENIRARRYFWPGCHRMPVYAAAFSATGRTLTVTDQACAECLVLPTGTAVSAGDIEAISEVIRFAVANAGEITHRLAQRAA